MSDTTSPMSVFNSNPWSGVFGKKINIDSQQMPRILRHIEVDEEDSSGNET